MACILVVDDDEQIRKHVGSILRSQGHWIIEAVDGVDAERRLAAVTPDLLITDLTTPGFDGLEVIAAARRRYPMLKVLAISGNSAKDTFFRAAEMFGADAALAKPFRAAQLREVVTLILSLSASDRQTPVHGTSLATRH